MLQLHRVPVSGWGGGAEQDSEVCALVGVAVDGVSGDEGLVGELPGSRGGTAIGCPACAGVAAGVGVDGGGKSAAVGVVRGDQVGRQTCKRSAALLPVPVRVVTSLHGDSGGVERVDDGGEVGQIAAVRFPVQHRDRPAVVGSSAWRDV